MEHGKTENSVPITQFSKNKSPNQTTTCKVFGPDNTLIDDILSCLELAFEVKATSPVMYNHSERQFFVFVAVQRRGTLP